MMKNKIITAVDKSHEAHSFHDIDGSVHKEIYIVDWKNINNGPVQWSNSLPVQHKGDTIEKGACVTNPNGVNFTVDLFDENALYIKKGQQAKQCECLLFPTNYSLNNWVLLVELKYAKTKDTLNQYKQNLKDKAIDNVDYFRTRCVFSSQQKINVLVSFPHFDVDVYGPYIFDTSEIDEMLNQYKIKLRLSDKVRIISDTRISLGT